MKKYIILTGGQLFNKGAQAMTLICVNEMAKRYPNHEVILLSTKDAERSKDELKLYKFVVIKNLRYRENLIISNRFLRTLYCKLLKNDKISEYEKIYNNTDLILDISGYALGSNWGFPFGYTLNLFIAKSFDIPMYLMPQSFGPFDYKGKYKFLCNLSIRKSLNYAKVIMGRENEGVELLRNKYGLTNVIKTYDMVLQSPPIEDYNMIFNEELKKNDLDILQNSVAVIPNSKNFKYAGEAKANTFYVAIIEELLRYDRHIYLLFHSTEDFEICKSLKEKFLNNEYVHLISQELSSIEFSDVVCKFDYVIASRYHSIIHSYKKGVPAVILGWAVKYHELANAFGQEGYCLDIREDNTIGDIVTMIRQMDQKYKNESTVIIKALRDIEQDNVFKYIE